MEETSKATDKHGPLNPSQLIDLYKHYSTLIQAELGFCHQYLNFYSGLLSAILAATLAGLLSLKFRGLDELTLLLGPILIVVLACNGYKTVQTFYRRFAEAWVTTINLESMLDIRYPKGDVGEPIKIKLDPEPVYISYENSFIPTYYWPPIRDIFDSAKRENRKAEKVAEELGEKGTTLTNAKITFIAFELAAVALAMFIILTVAFPSIFQQWLPGQ